MGERQANPEHGSLMFSVVSQITRSTGLTSFCPGIMLQMNNHVGAYKPGGVLIGIATPKQQKTLQA
jgi:hypothetical protein